MKMRSSCQPAIIFLASTFLVLNQIFVSFDLQKRYDIESAIDGQETPPEQQEEPLDLNYGKAHMWSAFARQHSTNVTEFDASIQWRPPGMDKVVTTRRSAMELLTYGLSGVLPWYSKILPSLKFDIPFQKGSQVHVALVEGLVDATLDLHQCTIGRDIGEADGYFDACFPPQAAGRAAGKAACFRKGEGLTSKARIYNYPAPGHERWSCSDPSTMEQLAAAQVLDYIISHGDRLYRERTKNLFFLRDERPIKFVSIDHHSNVVDFFNTKREYKDWARAKILLEHDLPPQLQDEIKTIILLGSKEEFTRKYNATINGQLDNLANVIVDLFAESRPDKERPKSITDIIWKRLESVVQFYNMTIDN